MPTRCFVAGVVTVLVSVATAAPRPRRTTWSQSPLAYAYDALETDVYGNSCLSESDVQDMYDIDHADIVQDLNDAEDALALAIASQDQQEIDAQEAIIAKKSKIHFKYEKMWAQYDEPPVGCSGCPPIGVTQPQACIDEGCTGTSDWYDDEIVPKFTDWDGFVDDFADKLANNPDATGDDWVFLANTNNGLKLVTCKGDESVSDRHTDVTGILHTASKDLMDKVDTGRRRSTGSSPVHVSNLAHTTGPLSQMWNDGDLSDDYT